ncbi:MAG: hypothetical protein LBB94_04300 [Clostridiales bacterium]|jgi:hypothetical protein|nr:hypothetical protein [Clostridiales bacterium]
MPANDKVEIAFFPYKASMWDCMESIWLAAKDDPACHVSVVPIPYFDRARDGGAAAIHYEADLMPEYVQITKYVDYDLSVIKPDVAYIHSVYDDHNRVTSVHPHYYTRELKKYIKTLVYVPYYGGGAPSVPKNFADITAMSAVDIAIADNEAHRLEYLTSSPRADIAALGAPKADKILSLEKRPPNPRKVFLLNTSIASLIKYGVSYFRKISDLFAYAERRGVSILWRPHPLTEATVNAMLPELARLYELLKQRIRQFGVLDESPDMYPAIAASDAYVGDGNSSLVYLYSITGKPLFIMDFSLPFEPSPDIVGELRNRDLLYVDFSTAENNIAWGFCASVNALCRLDICTGRAEPAGGVPGERDIAGLYLAPVKAGNKLLLTPYFASEWALYDPDTAIWEKLPILPEMKRIAGVGGMCVKAADYRHYVIFAPTVSAAFVRFNILTGEFETFSEWFAKMPPYIENINSGLFTGSSFALGDKLFLPSPQRNIIAELDMRTMDINLRFIGSDDLRFSGIAYDGGDFWLGDFRGRAVRWNHLSGAVKIFETQCSMIMPEAPQSAFSDIIYSGGHIWLCPYGCKEMFRINPVTEEMSKVELGLDLSARKSPCYNIGEGVALTGMRETPDKKLMAVSLYDYGILAVDPQTAEVETREIFIDGLNRASNADYAFHYPESVFFTIPDFINADLPPYSEAQSQYALNSLANSDGSAGRKIHGYVCRFNRDRRD